MRHKIGLWPAIVLGACALACGNDSKGGVQGAGGFAGVPASNGGAALGGGGTPPAAGMGSGGASAGAVTGVAGTPATGGVPAAGGTSMTSAGGVSNGGAANSGASNGGIPAGGTAGGGASNGGGGFGAGTHADPMCTTITTDPKLMGTACNNATDRCFFEDHASQAYSLGSKCATGDCLMYALQPETDMAKQCFLDCFKKQLMMQTGGVLSDACAACSNAVVVCGAKNCLSDCINDPMSSGCFECLCKAHDAMDTTPAGSCLVDVYAQCAGFAPPPALVGCPAM